MKYKLYIITICATLLALFGARYGIRAYFHALKTGSQVEVMAVRTRSMRHQVGELEQKLRVMSRVNHFLEQAAMRGLSADQWSVYAVNIDDQVSFQSLDRIVDQCTHSTGLYFKPKALHVAVGPPVDDSGRPVQSARPAANASGDSGAADVVLGLQGAFIVRH